MVLIGVVSTWIMWTHVDNISEVGMLWGYLSHGIIVVSTLW